MRKITICRLAKVIHFSALLNVMNVYFIVSLVHRAFVQMIIIRDYSITSDVLIWMHSGPVQRIQYENFEECFFEEIKLGEHFGFEMFPKPMGPFPPGYDGGIRAAIGILSRSNRLGRHEEKQKFSSSQKARSAHANVFMASALGGATSKSVRSDKGHQALTSDPTDTEWFNRFMTGLRARIGERRRQDAAISISLMLEMQKKLEANC
jgi:hypothetical protein